MTASLVAVTMWLVVIAGCGKSPHELPDAAVPAVEQACAGDANGMACLFEQWDRVRKGDCDLDLVAAFVASIEAREGKLPAWDGHRALFISRDRPVGVAGEFNSWDPTKLPLEQICNTTLFAAAIALPSGRYQYKVVDGAVWSLDPHNWAFAYDDFAGNADGRNSLLNTYDSGFGHLESPPTPLCSDALHNCRRFVTYLPPGYGAPANADRHYPALFMHDGQNLFDDHDCCYGHTGWELNVTLDAEIAAGRVEPIVIVGFPHAGDQRVLEYATPEAEGGLRSTFIDFQVNSVQPTAASKWRLDPHRYYTAGSSAGGNIAMHLVFAHPEIYVGAASLSGAFQLGSASHQALADVVAAASFMPVALYLDHGGTVADGADFLQDNIAMRDLLQTKGWTVAMPPSCSFAPNALCYFHADGALHNELAWRDRSYLFLRFLFAPK